MSHLIPEMTPAMIPAKQETQPRTLRATTQQMLSTGGHSISERLRDRPAILFPAPRNARSACQRNAAAAAFLSSPASVGATFLHCARASSWRSEEDEVLTEENWGTRSEQVVRSICFKVASVTTGMANTLGFSVSIPANLSRVSKLRFLSSSFRDSKCLTLNGLRLRAMKPGFSVSCPEICRSISPTARALDSNMNADSLVGEFAHDPSLPVSAGEAQDSSLDTGWDTGVTRLEEISHGMQGFRVSDASSQIHMESSPVGSFQEFMKTGVIETSLSHSEKAWDHWNKLGAPNLIVAPMMDQSELPFRMLCRKYGATGAYTPMFHSRAFAFQAGYRRIEFTTCPEDRPLFVQFGANDPKVLLKAAMFVQEHCDYVDINLGCPQRVAKRGRYGAFLMDDMPLIQSMLSELATGLTTPVSCKIRIFPDLEDTLAYARMLESAGCSLLAVHGRTRDQKDSRATRADWEAIKAVKNAVRIPVLANGNIRWLGDVHECIRITRVDGVMSAESLLENPALFQGHRMKPVEDVVGSFEELSREGALNELSLTLEYLDLCKKYPVTKKMIRAHVYKLLVSWFHRYPELRDEMNGEQGASIDWIRGMVYRLLERHISFMATGSSRECELHHEISHLAQLQAL